MPYDPCGTMKLEGSEILKRLAQELGTDSVKVKAALLRLLEA